jgi:hypothetical protein
MSTLLCWIWPYLCGAFVGWLAAGLLARLFAQTPRTVVREVEKIIERPVPKLIDNPAHLERIRTLEAEAGAATTHVAQLRTQLQQLQSAPPKIVERIIDRVIEIPVTDDKELAALRARLADSEAELKALQNALAAGARK